MNKIAFAFSALLTWTGLCLAIFCGLAMALYPKIGYLILQTRSSYSYDPRSFRLDLSGFQLFALACMVGGLILCCKFYGRRREDDRPSN